METKKRGRPKLPESPARQFILKAAAQLFRKNGFSAVSVESICERAGVSKMTFYRHFTNRVDVALKIFADFFSEEIQWASELLVSELTFVAKMNQLLGRREKNLSRIGMDFLQEFYQQDSPEIIAFWVECERRIKDVNLRFLKAGQDSRIVSDLIKPEIFLFLLKKRNEMYGDKELQKICPNQRDRFEIVNSLFYHGIMNPQKE